MTTFFFFGDYSLDSIGKISAARTDKATALIKKNGGKLRDAYALLGEHDLVLIVDLPDVEQAVKTSVGLSKALGISFTTAPAIPVAKFDKLIGKG